MRLIVGLGNPGDIYRGTRHNVGFQAIDHLGEELTVSWHACSWQARIAHCALGGETVILVKPETYMNESGRAVSLIAAHYRISPSDIIVLHDDLDLELGRIKVVSNRGAGGHNGILSLIDHLHSREFVRVRIGIGRPDPSMPIVNYVLARFLPEEQAVLLPLMDTMRELLSTILEKGPLSAMSAWNSRKVI